MKVLNRTYTNPSRGKGVLPTAFLIAFTSILMLTGCARMGNPDGGWYDDTPPYVVNASPTDGGINVAEKKIFINFNEFIKLENAQEKVIVSPPQIEQADIKTQGKRIVVELKDSLKPNTTYTVDFSDAITDNSEGNPMGQYTYSFSTGDHIDTLEVSGYCLNAEDLEPLKGLLVGLHPANAHDSAFRSQPMMRVSRTNGSGRFAIKGVAPGSYRVYALKDADGDYLFSQKSELVAFMHDSIVPSWRPDTRQDTIWLDSLHIANIQRVPYTRFLPDDLALLCFQEPLTDRFLLKTERPEPHKLGICFTYGDDSLPQMKGLNFDADNAFIVEASERRDSLVYWLRDSTLINTDTLIVEMTTHITDTLGQLSLKTDTLTFTPKVSYEKRLKEQQKELEKWQKEQDKKKKKGERYDSIMPVKALTLQLSSRGQIDPTERILFETPEPLDVCDTAKIHLSVKVDSLWNPMPHDFRQLTTRTYALTADWQLGTEYSLVIDSAAFKTIYGVTSGAMKQGLKVRSEDDYCTLFVDISGLPADMTNDDSLVVQLLDKADKVVRQTVRGKDGTAEFFYLKPGSYYMRAYADTNGNGQWDTGLYDEGRQAEPVYYYNEELDCKAKWDLNRRWNLSATPRHKQKPLAITKQKPDKQKQLKDRNAERAKKLGKPYVRDAGPK